MNKKVLILVLAFSIILASFSLVSAAPDIQGHWAQKGIDYLIGHNIVAGDPNGNFRPNDQIKRSEFIKMINKALNLTTKGNVRFSDVSSNKWFYEDIAIAVGAGYLDGYSDNTVKPDANISREEASTMIGRALGLNEVDNSGSRFTDSSKINSWARGYVNAISQKGYIEGYPSGEFKPQNNLKRAEAASIFTKVMGVEIEPSPSPSPSEEEEVLRLVNIERRKSGLKEFRLCPNLSRVARDKSKDMAYQGYFSHTSPTYGSPFDMMDTYGIPYWTAGENIAMGHKTPESVVNGWMNSPGHRSNILNSRFNTLGMGYHEFNGTTYWTQMFTN